MSSHLWNLSVCRHLFVAEPAFRHPKTIEDRPYQENRVEGPNCCSDWRIHYTHLVPDEGYRRRHNRTRLSTLELEPSAPSLETISISYLPYSCDARSDISSRDQK